MKRKVIITLEFNPADYLGVNPENDTEIKELFLEVIRGRTDFPDKSNIEISVVPRPKRSKRCIECGRMTNDPNCCQNDEDLWK